MTSNVSAFWIHERAGRVYSGFMKKGVIRHCLT